jgi:hypothetical protein
MLKKYTKYLFFFAVALALLAVSHRAFALETTYPGIPGFATIGPNSSLTDYLNYFFGVAIISAGLLGLISIVISGIRFLTSFGNPNTIGEAKERIFGSILGIILLLASFILLKTINPQLVNEQPVTLPIENGVYYIGNAPASSINNPLGIMALPAPISISSPSDIPSGYTALFYKCTPPGPDLFVWYYYPDGSSKLVTLQCKDINNDPTKLDNSVALNITADGGTFKRDYKKAGVYFYSQTDCQGAPTDVMTTSGNIDPAFQGHVLSYRIINGNTPSDPYYGFVLNKDPNLAGACSEPAINFTNGDINTSANMGVCLNIPANYSTAQSAYIIRGANPAAGYSGDGVSFYESGGYDNNGNPLPDGPRYIDLSPDTIGQQFSLDGTNAGYPYNNPDDVLKYEGALQPTSGTGQDTCMDPNYNLYPCTKSIDPRGNYLIDIYTENEAGHTNQTCGFFTSKIDDLSSQDILTSNRVIYRMDIFPTQP